MDQTVSRWVDK